VTPTPRQLWQVTEAVHAVAYFADEVAGAVASTGVTGWWRGYFAGRSAPMGAVGPEVVTAAFAGFAPAMVARNLPSAWAMATPDAVLAARLDGVAAALTRVDGDDGAVTSAAEAAGVLLDRAADAVPTTGRPLAAAWAGHRRRTLESGREVDPRLRAWLATTVLREHRGDAHVAALADVGLDGCEQQVVAAAAGRAPAALLRQARGWGDEDWAAAEHRLRTRGLLTGAGLLTPAGTAVREEVEAATDRSAARAWAVLDPDERALVAAALATVGPLVVARVPVPVPNPMGWEPAEP
jgi:hypothetical protein